MQNRLMLTKWPTEFQESGLPNKKPVELESPSLVEWCYKNNYGTSWDLHPELSSRATEWVTIPPR